MNIEVKAPDIGVDMTGNRPSGSYCFLLADRSLLQNFHNYERDKNNWRRAKKCAQRVSQIIPAFPSVFPILFTQMVPKMQWYLTRLSL
jgi:hypothetical protein